MTDRASTTSQEYHIRFKNAHGSPMTAGLRPTGKCFTLYLQSDDDEESIRDIDLVELRALQKLFGEVKL